jgi:hypothetical protein
MRHLIIFDVTRHLKFSLLCHTSPNNGAAWLSMVRRGSFMVRRGSVGWCDVAQLAARRLAVRQALG